MQLFQALWDGWVVLGGYALQILVFFVTTYGLGSLAANIATAAKPKIEGIGFSYKVGMGILMIPIPAFFAAFSSTPEQTLKNIGLFLLGLAILGIVLETKKALQHRIQIKWKTFVPLSILFFLLILARLAFLKYSLFPSYADSATHYGIIQDFLQPNPDRPSFYSIRLISQNYYHFGFHLLTAWMVSLFNLSIEKGILLVGQLMMAVFSLSSYSFVYTFTKDRKAAILAALIVGFAWQIPAFAVNWGKYPAIAGIALFPIPLTFLLKFNYSGKRDILSALFCVFLIIADCLFHSRILFCFLMAVICWILAGFISRIGNGLWKYGICSLLTILAAVLIFFDKAGLANYFLAPKILILLLFALLPFSFFHFQKVSIFMLLYFVFLAASVKIPSVFGMHHSIIPVFDETFALIAYSFPLAVLFATGLSGVTRLFAGKAAAGVTALYCLLIVFTINVPDRLYAHPCCNYLKQDEVESMAWIRQNIPDDSLLFIAGYPMRDYWMGVDAGIWIQPLTAHQTKLLSYTFAWNSSEGHRKACETGANFIFVGQTGDSFPREEFGKKDWYDLVFQNDSDAIYQVIGCK